MWEKAKLLWRKLCGTTGIACYQFSLFKHLAVTLIPPSSKPRKKQLLFSTLQYVKKDGIFPRYITNETRFLFFE